jgi:hypothetical protein
MLFEVLMAMKIFIMVCVLMPCGLVGGYNHYLRVFFVVCVVIAP